DLDGTIAASGSSWQEALNPPIYLVSLLPGLGVPLLAPAALRHPLGLSLATVAVILVQHAINLFNDAADWRRGADVEKHDSWVRVHRGRPRTAARHGLISLLAGGLLGLAVLWQQDQWWILLIALPMVGLGYLYNAGRRPLSYTHLGEWVTGICYGPGVFGCLWLVAGLDPDIGMLAGSIAFGALAMALLLSHQPPQIETDRRAGKRCFAVRYGVDRTVRVAQLLFMLFLACISAALLISADWQVGVVGALTALVGGVWVNSGEVNPRRVLLAASAFVMASLFASVGF
ncbi:MAG: prenyltransferase, partial [Sedimenticolaceae bacterium]